MSGERRDRFAIDADRPQAALALEMNRPEPSNDWQALRGELADRVQGIRRDLYGEHGGPLLAQALDLPFRLWSDYEGGALMPADVMLRFLEITGADPHWLLTGEGPRYIDDAR